MLAEFFTPHLARAMPGVANAVPWLLLLAIMMILGAVVASGALIRYRRRLTYEEARSLTSKGRRTVIHDAQKKLSWARRMLLGVAAFIGISWAVLWVTQRLGAEWTELVFSVLYGLVLLPGYVVIRLLERAFGLVAHRLDQISEEFSRNT